jgi:hypothetical protein
MSSPVYQHTQRNTLEDLPLQIQYICQQQKVTASWGWGGGATKRGGCHTIEGMTFSPHSVSVIFFGMSGPLFSVRFKIPSAAFPLKCAREKCSICEWSDTRFVIVDYYRYITTLYLPCLISCHKLFKISLFITSLNRFLDYETSNLQTSPTVFCA